VRSGEDIELQITEASRRQACADCESSVIRCATVRSASQTIANRMHDLRAKYNEIGVGMDGAALRLEAISFLTNGAPVGV
jgi:hypothetical protein